MANSMTTRSQTKAISQYGHTLQDSMNTVTPSMNTHGTSDTLPIRQSIKNWSLDHPPPEGVSSDSPFTRPVFTRGLPETSEGMRRHSYPPMHNEIPSNGVPPDFTADINVEIDPAKDTNKVVFHGSRTQQPPISSSKMRKIPDSVAWNNDVDSMLPHITLNSDLSSGDHMQTRSAGPMKVQSNVDLGVEYHTRHTQDTNRNYSSRYGPRTEYAMAREEIRPWRDSSELETRNRSRNSFRLNLPQFNGKGKWETFSCQFEAIARSCGWNDTEKLNHLLATLSGDATDFAFELEPHMIEEYDEIMNELEQRFIVIQSADTWKQEFSSRALKSNETAKEFAADLRRLIHKAYPAGLSRQVKEDMLIKQFFDGLNDDEVKYHVRYLMQPHTLHESVESLRKYDTYRGNKRDQQRVKASHQVKDLCDEEVEEWGTDYARPVKSFSQNWQPTRYGTQSQNNRPVDRRERHPLNPVQDKSTDFQADINALQTEMRQLKKDFVSLEKVVEKSIEKSEQNLKESMKEMMQDFKQPIFRQGLNTPNNHSKNTNRYEEGNRGRLGGNPQGSEIRCYGCSELGHYARDCPRRLNNVRDITECDDEFNQEN